MSRIKLISNSFKSSLTYTTFWQMGKWLQIHFYLYSPISHVTNIWTKTFEQKKSQIWELTGDHTPDWHTIINKFLWIQTCSVQLDSELQQVFAFRCDHILHFVVHFNIDLADCLSSCFVFTESSESTNSVSARIPWCLFVFPTDFVFVYLFFSFLCATVHWSVVPESRILQGKHVKWAERKQCVWWMSGR